MSLRARLVAVMCVVAAVALAVAGVATYRTFRSSQIGEIDDTLQRLHEPIERAIEEGEDDTQREIETLAPGVFVAVTGGARELSIPARVPGHTSLTVDVDGLSAPLPAGRVDPPVYTTRTAEESGAELRLRVSRLGDGSILVLGLSLEELEETQEHLVTIELIVGAIALMLSAVVGWILVRAGLRPLRQVETSARRIAADGRLDDPIPASGGPREVASVVIAMNTMLDRIRDSFAARDAQTRALAASEQRMRRFVADVSHELRTPIAAVAAYSELVDRGARNHPEDLDRALRGISLETARMRELVEELLLLARLDEGPTIERRLVDLNDVVIHAVAAARAVDREHPIELDVHDVVFVLGDAGRLRQVFDNLLANARTHTPAGTRIDVTVAQRDGEGVVIVADDGPGLTAEQAEHVFDRFFRADPSRSRGSGGAGLGMAIVTSIVEAHNGQVGVSTSPGNGFVVTVTLPVTTTTTAAAP